jgi:hypothetical protein
LFRGNPLGRLPSVPGWLLPSVFLLLAMLHHTGAVLLDLAVTPRVLAQFSRLRGAVSQRLLPLATHAKDAPSLRCAKLGVASAETATPIITPARYLFIRTMSSISLQVFPRTEVTQPRGNRRLRSSALRQACVPPSKERLQKCHPMRRASGKAAASLPIALRCYSLTEKV